MNTLSTITDADCIELTDRDRAQIGKEPRIDSGSDPRLPRFSLAGKRAGATGTLLQRGLLIINDGTDADTDVWQRLTLRGSVPVEALSEDILIKRMLGNAEIRERLAAATVVVAPLKAGPRFFDAVRKADRNAFASMRARLEPKMERTGGAGRRAEVTLSSGQGEYLQSRIRPDDRVVILDDVASTYQTGAILSGAIRAQRTDLITLVATNPKNEDMPLIAESGLTGAYAALVTQYAGGRANDRPAITTTAGIFDRTDKAKMSRNNIKRYLQDGGAAMTVLERRIMDGLRLGLFDLDGTLLENGTLNPDVARVLLSLRRDMFTVVATGRSTRSYDGLPADVRNLFDAGILENGAVTRVAGTNERVIDRKLDPVSLKTVIRKAEAKAGVQTRITEENRCAPWWIRVRAKNGNLDSGEFTAEDTAAALAFACMMNARETPFGAQASGNGDVIVGWRGTDKGLTGIDGLARRLPTLPALSTGTAAGDGPNDIEMLRRLKKAGGTTIAVGGNTEAREAAAKRVDNPAALAAALEAADIRAGIGRALMWLAPNM